ncbi:hypothetical protein ElyMa_004742000 [Elysia marginata]|uniref:Uncharacterized protein n=1 Tax=Elysia marginata TaxID=1093978 RepID=A0AAV4IBL6_9GAST|nr:hypothetical protein ElyMa_004742000 [Elysia marginata]
MKGNTQHCVQSVEAWMKTCGRSRRREMKEEPHGAIMKKRPARPRQKIPVVVFSPPLPPPCLSNTCLIGIVRRSQQERHRERGEGEGTLSRNKQDCLFCSHAKGGGVRVCLCLCDRDAPAPPRPVLTIFSPLPVSLSSRFLLEDTQGSEGAGGIRWNEQTDGYLAQGGT